MTRKPRVFLDTNTLVSGIVFAGNERKLLDAIIDGKIEWVLSTNVTDEANAVLEKKFPKHAVLFTLFLNLVRHEKTPKSKYKNSVKQYSKLVNKKDAPILAAAIEGNVDYLITGDKKLRDLKQVKNTKIIRTRKLLKLEKLAEESANE
ncbi:hypothetical protein AKJ47_01285 [candidate division MSBL1 archaeon SCGC-AAA261G05]|uniref:PIN domain-containing protein n=2 Tax=candidate division MSBL1 TaxID=215777 RepID=A0A133VBY9_9EURY|nr:hypothetical protein AKJ47_01285 [candidate division MSBL1 archaeon SCGC-AAA261G05]KXB04799.1 hypothetical protein AKJ48_01330 [candidate division MSBL1 archaeon SCGC-AAA261O19]